MNDRLRIVLFVTMISLVGAGLLAGAASAQDPHPNVIDESAQVDDLTEGDDTQSVTDLRVQNITASQSDIKVYVNVSTLDVDANVTLNSAQVTDMVSTNGTPQGEENFENNTFTLGVSDLGGEENTTIDFDIEQLDTDNVVDATGLDYDVEATGGTTPDDNLTGSDGSPDATNNQTGTFNVNAVNSNFEIVDVEPWNTSVIEEGNNETYNVTVNNTGDDQDTQNVTATVDPTGFNAIDSEELTLNSSENATVELEPDTSGVTVVDSETFDVEIETEDDFESGQLTIFDVEEADNLFTGDVGDLGELPINTSEVRVDLTYIGGTGDVANDVTILENVSLQAFSELPDVQDPEDYDAIDDNAVISGTFIENFPDEKDDYNVRFAHFGDGSRYLLEADSPGFEAFDGDRTFDSAGTSETVDIRLERLVTPDEIDIDKTPAGGTVDIGESINDVVTVWTEDEEPVGDLSQMEDTPVDVTILDSNTDEVDGVTDANLEFDPVPPQDTDEQGEVEFDISLEGVDEDAVDETVEFTLEWEATEGQDVTQEQEIEFVPDVGDTGTISGEVDRITDDQLLGTQSSVSEENRTHNIQPAENVPVWAVSIEDVGENTARLQDGQNISTDIPDNLVDDGYTLDITEVSTLEDRQFRAVTYDEEGDEVLQDPRSDYLTATQDNIEVIQNETSVAFEVHERGSGVGIVDLAFLAPQEDPGYQIQQRTPVSNGTNTQYLWQNVTFNEIPNAGEQTTSNQTFDVTQDIRFDAIDERFEDDFVNPTDFTNEAGDFELHNLPTDQGTTELDALGVEPTDGQNYAVIAGAGDRVSAVDDVAVGFANFRGYDVVSVEPDAQDPSPAQYNVDLSVQDFEPVVDLIYNIDVTAEDWETGGLEKVVNIPAGTTIDVQFEVMVREIGEPEEDAEPADGIDLDTELLENVSLGFNDAGSLADDTVTVTDGTATTEFTAVSSDAPQFVGESSLVTNATAETSAVTDRDGQPFRAEDGEQAEINVFLDAEIEGSVTDEDDTLVPNADVDLFRIEPDGSLTLIDSTNTGQDGSFSFTNVPAGQDYRVVATDVEGNTGFNEGQLQNLPAGSTTAGIVITDAVVDPGTLDPDNPFGDENNQPLSQAEVSSKVFDWLGDNEIDGVEYTQDEISGFIFEWLSAQ